MYHADISQSALSGAQEQVTRQNVSWIKRRLFKTTKGLLGCFFPARGFLFPEVLSLYSSIQFWKNMQIPLQTVLLSKQLLKIK